MSLDVYLIASAEEQEVTCYACGHTHKEMVKNRVFDYNITHNLGEMASKAGLYKVMWRPYLLKATGPFRDHNHEYEVEQSITTYADELIPFLEKGLADLISNPEYYKKFNASNGWGTYEALAEFAKEYLKACKEYPDAKVEVSR